jgi:ribonuclease R
MAKKKKINKGGSTSSGSLQRDLMEFLSTRPDKGFSLKNIIKWSLKHNEGSGLFDVIEELIFRKKIEEYAEDKFRIVQTREDAMVMTGVVDLTRSGNAYVIIDGKLNDIFVPASKTNRAFNGDTVLVQLRQRRKGGSPEGEIIEVVKRAKDTFIGHIRMNDGFAFAETDRQFNNYDFYISPEEIRRSGVADNDRVIVRIKDWPPAMKNPIGIIIGKLGPAGVITRATCKLSW